MVEGRVIRTIHDDELADDALDAHGGKSGSIYSIPSAT